MKIKEKIISLEEVKSDIDVVSVRRSKEKEQLLREEVEVNNSIKKITYLMGEKYKLYMSVFSVFVIAVIPLLMSSVVYVLYVLYNRMLVKKARECINDKK